jgi:hypothetical protein
LCFCKYLKASGPRKTKPLAIKNVRFYYKRRLLQHTDPKLHLASTVSITFEEQKQGTKNDAVAHHWTSYPLLYPVKIWCIIIRRLISYPTSSPDTTVNSFQLGKGSIHTFSGKELLSRLRMAATSLGPDIRINQIGLHSAKSGAAVAMYLTGVPVFTIMLLGHWSSDAFLRYIRKQVQEFSASISSQMIQNEDFYTIPLASHDDPRTQNHPLTLALQNTLGPISGML